MTAFETFKYILSKIEGIPQKLGFRNYRAYIVKTLWSRSTIGDGYATTTETEIVLEDGYAPLYKEETDKVLFSGTSTQRIVLGPIPVSYTYCGVTKGYDSSSFVCNSKNEEIYIKIVIGNQIIYYTISEVDESTSKISNKLILVKRQ
jgi:hypothetical protein